MSPTDPARPSAPMTSAERWCSVSGAAATALVFSSGAFAPNPPTHGGTDAALLAHFRTQYDGTMKGVLVWMLGAMALLLFAATVVRVADRARRAAGREAGILPTFTLMAAVTAVGMLVAAQSAAGATAVIGHHATDPSVARGLDEIGHMLAHLSVLPLGLFGLALGLTLLDARLVSRWLAGAGVAIGAALSLSGIWVVVGGTTLHDVGGLFWLSSMLWWAALSATLVWTGRRGRVPAGIAAPTALAA